MAQSRRSRSPAGTPEFIETRLISKAYELAETQLEDGSATAQVITHFLKLGSSRERLEQEKIKNENLMLAARVEQIASQQRVEELYAEALIAMRKYAGIEDPTEELSDGYDGY